MGVYRKGSKWFIDYYYQGRRIREIGGLSKTQAEKALHVRKAEILQGRFSMEQLKPSPFFEAFAREYLEWSHGNKRSYRRGDLTRMGALLPFFRRKRLAEITPWLVEKYKLHRRERVKPATLNRELALLSHMFTKAIEWGRTLEHPIKGGRVKKFREDAATERLLSDEEETQLLAAASPGLRPLIMVALDTGMRLSEILELAREQVDLQHGEIHLTRTKSGKSRRVPLTRRVRELLSERCRQAATDQPAVFTQGPRSIYAVRRALLAAVRRAGISPLRFHDLRHTFATRLVLAGVDLATVQKLLGHSDIRITLRYAHPKSQDMRRAIFLLDSSAENRHHMDTAAIPLDPKLR